MTQYIKKDVLRNNEHRGNIENFIGFTNIPTGIIEELNIQNRTASFKTIIPLATTEGALVASYNRGCKVMNLAGGVTSIVVDHGVQRVPTFVFDNLNESLQFADWVDNVKLGFQKIVDTKTNYGKLKSCTCITEGNIVNVEFVYTTGDASGQNMVTFCTDEICNFILEEAPVSPKRWYIEGNQGGDKKASNQFLKTVRGRKVISDIKISKEIVIKHLKTTPEAIVNYWQVSMVNQVMSGACGSHGHLSNGLTAIFLATGQDVACAAESSVGVSRFNLTDDGDLYACLTLPSLMVGTVGGGTGMAYAQNNLKQMNCLGLGKADQFAEIIGGLLLAGELSIAAAMAANHFTSAHQRLGRK